MLTAPYPALLSSLFSLPPPPQNSLKKYKTFHKLAVPNDATKAELVAAVSKHFNKYPRVRDSEVIQMFLYANEEARKRELTEGNE